MFYDTYGTYNVLLDSDTGELFNWNTFALSKDNSKHILFLAIISILAYPIYLISNVLSNSGMVDYKYVYGIGLTIIQVVVSATLIDIAAIPLLGLTLTNIYLYFINLVLQFKLSIKKNLKHLTIFVLVYTYQ